MIKVLIADDQELIRQSLKIVLSVSQDLEVVDTVSNGAEAVKSVGIHRPDVVLMDVRMPEMDGVEATRIIKERYPQTSVIVLTTFDDDEYVFGALKNGASGYLLKGSGVSELAESIKIAYHGGAMINPNIASKVLSQFSHLAKNSTMVSVDDRAIQDISKSEWPVIRCVGCGMSNKEIAQDLCLSEGTVRNAISSVLYKLNLRDRTQLAIWAVQSGVVNGGVSG